MNKKYKENDDEIEEDDVEDDEVIKERRKIRFKTKRKFRNKNQEQVKQPKIKGFQYKKPRRRDWEEDEDFLEEDFAS